MPLPARTKIAPVVRRIRRCLRTQHICVRGHGSGDTGSSMAAYCARYGVRCFVVVDARCTRRQARTDAGSLCAGSFRVNDFISSPETTQRVFDVLSRLALERNIPLIVSAFRYCPRGCRGWRRFHTSCEIGFLVSSMSLFRLAAAEDCSRQYAGASGRATLAVRAFTRSSPALAQPWWRGRC